MGLETALALDLRRWNWRSSAKDQKKMFTCLDDPEQRVSYQINGNPIPNIKATRFTDWQTCDQSHLVKPGRKQGRGEGRKTESFSLSAEVRAQLDKMEQGTKSLFVEKALKRALGMS